MTSTTTSTEQDDLAASYGGGRMPIAEAVSALQNALVLTDPHLPDNPIVHFNAAFAKLTGYSAEEILGHNCRFLQGEDTDPAEVARLSEAIREERGVQVTLLNYRKDGSPFWNELTVAPVRSQAGELTHFVGVQTDISVRKAAEEAYAQQAATLREKARLVDLAHDALIVHDMDGRITYFNESAEQMYGFSASEALGKDLSELLHITYPVPKADVRRALEERGIWDGELAQSRRDGTRVYVESRQALVRDEAGAPVSVLEINHNVTDRRAAEIRLKRARDLADGIVQTVREPLLALDADLRVLSANQAFYTTFEVSPEETEGRRVYELGNGQWDLPELRELLESLLPQNNPFEGFQVDHKFPTIGRRVMLLNARRLEGEVRDEGGVEDERPTNMILLAIEDATERERATESLRHTAARQRAFLRDVLSSVTEGRLRLCETEADLPAPPPNESAPVALTMTDGLRALRLRVRETAQACEFPDERWQDLVTAASEAGMNAVVHGGGSGEARVYGGGDAIQVWVRDHGVGIQMDQLPKATLSRGWSSKGAASLGHGLVMMLQSVDRLWLLTGSQGTTVVLEQSRDVPLPEWLA